MNTSRRHKLESPISRQAICGLVLTGSALTAPRKQGINCTPGVALENQHLTGTMDSGDRSGAQFPIWAGRADSSRWMVRRLRGYSHSFQMRSMAAMQFFLQKACRSGHAA